MLKLTMTALIVLGLSAGVVLAAGGATKTADPWTEKWGDLGPDYTAAETLVKEEKYAEAITALEALNKPEDPRVLNWLGFSHRKMGETVKAIELYTKALTIAPEFTPAHEYLGEAYIQAKDLEKAKAELATIETLCGNQECEEYKDLKESLDKAATGAS